MIAFRNCVIYMIILNVLGSAFIMPLVYLDFSLRRDYIAEILCINRDEPVAFCGGKCYLDEQLEKAARHQDNESNAPRRASEISFFVQEYVPLGLSNTASDIKIAYLSYKQLLFPSSFCEDIFHPPQVSFTNSFFLI